MHDAHKLISVSAFNSVIIIIIIIIIIIFFCDYNYFGIIYTTMEI